MSSSLNLLIEDMIVELLRWRQILTLFGERIIDGLILFPIQNGNGHGARISTAPTDMDMILSIFAS